MVVVPGFSDDEDIWFLEGAQFNNCSPFVVVRNTPTDVDMHNMQSRCGEGGVAQHGWCVQGGEGVFPWFILCLSPTS